MSRNFAQDTSEDSLRQRLDSKKANLFAYNLLMFVVFLMVYMILLIKGLTGAIDDDSVKEAAFIIKLLTFTQLLEAIHPMLGLQCVTKLLSLVSAVICANFSRAVQILCCERSRNEHSHLLRASYCALAPFLTAYQGSCRDGKSWLAGFWQPGSRLEKSGCQPVLPGCSRGCSQKKEPGCSESPKLAARLSPAVPHKICPQPPWCAGQ